MRYIVYLAFIGNGLQKTILWRGSLYRGKKFMTLSKSRVSAAPWPLRDAQTSD